MYLGIFANIFRAALFTLIASPAFAEVCDKSRPGWTPEDGQVSVFGEALYQLTTPGIAGLLIVLMLALRFKNIWFTLIISLIAFVISYLLYIAWADPKGVMFHSINEGCVGAPYGAMGILFLVGAIAIFWQFRDPRRHH